MRRIPTPSWARPPERSVDDGFPERDALFEQHDQILALVEAAVQKYVDDPQLTFEGESFPRRNLLTGEFYIGDESFWVIDEPWFPRVGRRREYRFSVRAHCLEYAWLPNQVDTDYLCLEIHFVWHPEMLRFEHQGDVDSSSI